MIEDLDLTDDSFDSSDESDMTANEIYQTLLVQEDIIINIYEEDYLRMKKAVTALKGKENMKLVAKDMPVDRARLQFTQLPATDTTPPNTIRVQISLVKPTGFRVLSIEKSGEF